MPTDPVGAQLAAQQVAHQLEELNDAQYLVASPQGRITVPRVRIDMPNAAMEEVPNQPILPTRRSLGGSEFASQDVRMKGNANGLTMVKSRAGPARTEETKRTSGTAKTTMGVRGKAGAQTTAPPRAPNGRFVKRT